MSTDTSRAAPVVGVKSIVKSDDERIDIAIAFWDETEGMIKRAEHINHQMIVPAVSELRYAGRKLIDYLSALRGGLDDQTINSHLDDFTQCCIRARHDAIDAIISYAIEYLERMEDEAGADTISAEFPLYLKYKMDLRKVVDLIISSRQDRSQRNEIYAEVRKTYVDKIIDNFYKLDSLKSEIFIKKAKSDKKQYIASLVMALALVVVSFASIAAIVVFLK